MRKNRMMRLASILMIAVLMTTCTISGTFAKYVTEATGTDSARVAKWGFDAATTTASMQIDDLFDDVYTDEDADYDVDSADDTDVIAPGTWGSATFAFAYKGDGEFDAPEVAYKFDVNANASTIDSDLKAYSSNIQWKLDDAAWGDWDTMITAINNLSQERVEPNNLPTSFAAGEFHTITWRWIFTNGADSDVKDTGFGNAADLVDDVKVIITITATQIDD